MCQCGEGGPRLSSSCVSVLDATSTREGGCAHDERESFGGGACAVAEVGGAERGVRVLTACESPPPPKCERGVLGEPDVKHTRAGDASVAVSLAAASDGERAVGLCGSARFGTENCRSDCAGVGRSLGRREASRGGEGVPEAELAGLVRSGGLCTEPRPGGKLVLRIEGPGSGPGVGPWELDPDEADGQKSNIRLDCRRRWSRWGIFVSGEEETRALLT